MKSYLDYLKNNDIDKTDEEIKKEATKNAVQRQKEFERGGRWDDEKL